jgi:hypothetical protein
MKYCVKSRQPINILRKVDEIRVEYRDREQILDFFEKLENKTYLINVPGDVEIDKQFIAMLAEKGNIILELNHITVPVVSWCFDNGIKWCWAYPITSFFELNSILWFKPSYLKLGAPLCFSLDKVCKYNIPIRLIANQANLDYIPRVGGICGPWIRPEGVAAYEQYVDVLEFESSGLEQEATYFRIYAEDKQWKGNLNFLIPGLNIDVIGQGLPQEIDEIRTVCGQRCMEGHHCSFCTTGIKFSNALEKKVKAMAKNSF